MFYSKGIGCGADMGAHAIRKPGGEWEAGSSVSRQSDSEESSAEVRFLNISLEEGVSGKQTPGRSQGRLRPWFVFLCKCPSMD